MVGRIVYRQEKGREKPCRVSIGTLPVLNISLFDPPELPRGKLDRRLEKLERTLLSAGVNRVILPARFPYTGQLRYLRSIDLTPFYCAAADILVLKLLERRGVLPAQSRVALTANRLCPALIQAANALCREIRGIRIDLPGEEGERLAWDLQRQFGVPTVPCAAAVDVTLSFGGEGGDLRLWDRDFDLSGLRLKARGVELPPDEEAQVLALLWEQGRLRREDLWVADEA